MPGWDANGMVREEMRRHSLRGSGWDDIFSQHCTALGALLAGRAVDAYAQLVAYTQPFLKVLHPVPSGHPYLFSYLELVACTQPFLKIHYQVALGRKGPIPGVEQLRHCSSRQGNWAQ